MEWLHHLDITVKCEMWPVLITLPRFSRLVTIPLEMLVQWALDDRISTRVWKRKEEKRPGDKYVRSIATTFQLLALGQIK